VPYPGQIPGIGGGYDGDFTAGADLGLPGLNPYPTGGITIELPPGTYDTPGGGTVTKAPDGTVTQTTPGSQNVTPAPPEPVYPFNPSGPPPYEPVEPTVGNPVHGDDPTAGGDWPTEPYYPPPKAAPARPGQVLEGEYTPGPVRPGGVDRLPSGGWDPSQILDRILGGVIGRIVSRVAGGPIGTVIEEIFTPTQIDPEPDVRQWGASGSWPAAQPSPIPSSPAAPPTAAGRPQRPELPPVPRAPTVSVPKPDIGDIKPWKFDSQPSTPATPPSSPSAPQPVSTPSSGAQRPATSSQPQPQSPAQPTSSGSTSPTWQFDPLPLFGWLNQRSSPISYPVTPISPTPRTTPLPTTAAGSTSAPAPTAPATATAPQTAPIPQAAGSAPPLTPIKPAALESLPAGDSCETPKQQKQRREKQREDCNRFITITIPKHRRRVCAAEAAHHLGKHLGKEIGRAIGEKLGLSKPRRESKHGKKTNKLRVSKRGGISYGGYGVTIPKQMRPRPPGEIPRL
jgi:hypothetical protein